MFYSCLNPQYFNLFQVKIIRLFSLFLLLVSCSCNDNDTTSTPVIQNPPVIVPPLAEAELLDQVQKDALKYFVDYAHPNSKLARERYHIDDPGNDANIVTTGGTGFGLMSILVGMERNFMSRAEGISRLTTGLNFLENADRFHGAWPHWMDGNTGNVIPFGTMDNGGDLVETSFVCQGLICIREYLKDGTAEEQALAQKADALWKGVEWDWYTKGENALYWHWSPTYEWQMNFKLQGYNECLITYILAKASPTHPISNACYTQGWARNGGIVNPALRYGIPVIFDYNGASGNVGPMFWSHYSYLGLDPRGLTDQYADYWALTQNHAKIMVAHCVANPYQYLDYSDECWGLTASYTRNLNGSVGYTAHQPNNDRGIISPTAALSSYPYTPVESLKFLRYLYEKHKDKYVGIAGPYDAFSPHYNWVTKRYLAIDQGTIVPMIENHRTGMLWNLFMAAPDVRAGLTSLGFHSTQHGF
jgi:hypothetical protein